MTQHSTRKKALIAGAAALLIAGISAGGALVTTNSTVFDNNLKTTATPANPAELIVTGSKLTGTFTGALDGEVASQYYTLENTSADKSLKFNLNSRVQPGGNKAAALAGALDTQWTVAGVTKPSATLAAMNIVAGDQITLAPGQTVQLRLDVFVEDAAAFQALALGDDAEVTVDFLFDSIFLPTP